MINRMFLYAVLSLVLVNLAESCRSTNTFSTARTFISATDDSTYEYSFSNAFLNKTEAEIYCADLQSNIADRYNESDLFDISSLLGQQNVSLNLTYYLGIILNSGEFVLERTGDIISQTSSLWGPDQPVFSNECVVVDALYSINQTGLRLFTVSCSARHRVACQRPRGSQWGAWSAWSSCNSFCQRDRIRTCSFPSTYGDPYCNTTEETQIGPCNYTNSIGNITCNENTTTTVMQSQPICDQQCTHIKVVIGSVIGSILFLILLVVIAITLYRKHHQNNSNNSNTNTHTGVNHHKVEPSAVKLRPSAADQPESRIPRDTAAINQHGNQNDEVEYVNFGPPTHLEEENYIEPLQQRQSEYEIGEEIYVNEPAGSFQQNEEEEYVAMQDTTYVNFHSP